jgi:hypothetical protein
MAIHDIVFEIDAEIARLQQVRSLLTATTPIVKAKLGRPAGVKFVPKTKTGRVLSPEARAKIAEAQKLRWAKFKKVAKKASAKSASVAKKAAAKKGAKTSVAAKKASLPTTPSVS